MQRRDFITLLGGAAAWPIVARGQQLMQAIGVLNGSTIAASQGNFAAFRESLADSGFFEGRNLAIVYRGADGDVALLPALAVELVRIPVVVIAAVGGDNAIFAAKAATTTIPIVFTTASDPTEAGLVPSLNRPGGNVTGATSLGTLVGAKQIGFLRDLVPKLATVGVLVSPLVSNVRAITREVQEAAQTIGIKAVALGVNSESDLDNAFVQFAQQRVDALIIGSGVFFVRQQDHLIALAKRYALPTICANRALAVAGGLMSYSADIRDAYRQAGIYVSRILKGDKPGDLPVMLPTRYELVINLKTAKAIGLTVPPDILTVADEVIE
jgi:putative ABC transport system substrate-binding protein